MQCNVCVHSCTTRWIPTCPSLLPPLPFIANLLLVFGQAALYMVLQHDYYVLGNKTETRNHRLNRKIDLKKKCRLWKIPMKTSLDHPTQFQELQQPRRPQIRRINCATPLFIGGQWDGMLLSIPVSFSCWKRPACLGRRFWGVAVSSL